MTVKVSKSVALYSSICAVLVGAVACSHQKTISTEPASQDSSRGSAIKMSDQTIGALAAADVVPLSQNRTWTF